MPTSGGAADKAGNRYERAVGVMQLIGLLRSELEDMTVEVPGVNWAEFKTTRTGQTTWWQAKRQRSGAPWSMHTLAEILTSFGPSLAAGDACAVALGDGCQPLRELLERRAGVVDLLRFRHHFLADEKSERSFELCKTYWEVDDDGAFEYLSRLELHPNAEGIQRAFNQARLEKYCGDLSQAATALLGELYDDSVHQTLTGDDVRAHLSGARLLIATGATPTTPVPPIWRRLARAALQDALAALEPIRRVHSVDVMSAGPEREAWYAASIATAPSPFYDPLVQRIDALGWMLRTGSQAECLAEYQRCADTAAVLEQELLATAMHLKPAYKAAQHNHEEKNGRVVRDKRAAADYETLRRRIDKFRYLETDLADWRLRSLGRIEAFLSNQQ